MSSDDYPATIGPIEWASTTQLAASVVGSFGLVLAMVTVPSFGPEMSPVTGTLAAVGSIPLLYVLITRRRFRRSGPLYRLLK